MRCADSSTRHALVRRRAAAPAARAEPHALGGAVAPGGGDGLARSGQHEDAARALDRDWKRLEEALAVSSMRRAWLLRAYLASGDGARGSVEPWLTLARGGRKGELAWLGAEWPELRAFIDAHDL